MQDNLDQLLNESRKRAVVERAILAYYNKALLSKGLITAEQHRRMQVAIVTRKPTSANTVQREI